MAPAGQRGQIRREMARISSYGRPCKRVKEIIADPLEGGEPVKEVIREVEEVRR